MATVNKKFLDIDGLKHYNDKIQAKLTTEANTRSTADSNLQSQIRGLASGAPLAASSTADMTDTTKIYVNTTDGYWYYWDGDSWEQGGVYQSAAGDISVTSQNVVDDSISYQKLNTNGKNGAAGFTQKKVLNLSWEQGSRHTTGSLVPSANTIVCKNTFKIGKGTKVTVKSGYVAFMYTWDGGSEHHPWSGWQQISRYFGESFSYLSNNFYISVRRSDSTNLTPDEGLNAIEITELQDVTKSGYSGLDNVLQKQVTEGGAIVKLVDTVSYGSATSSQVADFSYTNASVGGSSVTRAWLETPVFLPAGSVLTATNNWQFLVIYAETRYTTHKTYFPGSWASETTTPSSGNYYISFRKSDDSDLLTLTGDNFTDYFTIALPANGGASGGNVTMYVSGAGDDVTGDGSRANPYRQITKALSAGASTIICAPGYQYNNLNLSYVSNVNIIGSMDTYSTSDQVQDKPFFDNSIALEGAVLENGKIKIPYVAEAGSDMYACLVAQTKDLEDGTSSRSEGYYCTIFSAGDKDTSHRYIPVLTQDDVAGHFYYDGSAYIYVNPYSDNDASTGYSLVDAALQPSVRLVQLSNCSNISFKNFTFKHASDDLLQCVKCTGITVEGCEFQGSSQGENLGVTNTDVNVTNCVSYLARNDGYNFHGFGNSVVTKCIGCHCFDDGISHHDKCTHAIIGGEYYDNHKGGVSSPTYGCSGDIIGVYTHDNRYGIYASSDSTHGKSYANLNNNVVTGNTVGISLNNCTGVAYNNKVVDNTTNIVNTSDVVIY